MARSARTRPACTLDSGRAAGRRCTRSLAAGPRSLVSGCTARASAGCACRKSRGAVSAPVDGGSARSARRAALGVGLARSATRRQQCRTRNSWLLYWLAATARSASRSRFCSSSMRSASSCSSLVGGAREGYSADTAEHTRQNRISRRVKLIQLTEANLRYWPRKSREQTPSRRSTPSPIRRRRRPCRALWWPRR